MAKKILQDQDLEVIIGNLLRLGVIISSLVILTGGVIFLFNHGLTKPDYHTFRGLTGSLHSISSVVKGASKGTGENIIEFGVLLLIATPVARILFSILGFIAEKDRLYIVLTLIVLFIITSSVLLGLKA